jgi:S1-C subfamily serine protease
MKRNSSFKTGLLVSLLIFNFLANVQGQTASEVAQRSFPSVALIVMEDRNGQPLSLGSGFFVKEDIVVTNFHVIEGAARGYGKKVGQEKKYDLVGVVGSDANRDLVLLKLLGAKAPSLLLGDSGNAKVGDEVYVVGNPLGLEGTFSSGIISGIRQVDKDKLFQITAPISPGSSGGPVLNKSGMVIGIAVASYQGGQNLNFAIPSSYLESIIAKITSVTEISSMFPVKHQISILDKFGGKSTSGVNAGNLMWFDGYYQSGMYSFSINNRLREPIKEIYCLVIFYDINRNPIEFDLIQYRDMIPGGLAKRVNSRVDNSVQKLTTREGASTTTLVEFRILDFRIVY